MVIGLWPKITVKINFQNHLRIYLKKKNLNYTYPLEVV